MIDILSHIGDGALVGSAAIGAGGLYGISRRYARDDQTTRGSAKWLKLWKAHKFGLLKGSVSSGDNVILGDWHKWSYLPVYYNGPSNILTVGPPGSMKGVGTLIPNAMRRRFMFLYDPGGEVSSVCAAEWRRKGYKVHFINPWGMHKESPHELEIGGINFLDLIDPDSPTFSSDVLACCSALVPKKDEFEYFSNKAQVSYQALIMFCILCEKRENRNLVQVRRYIRGDLKAWSTLIDRMKNCPNEIVLAQANEWERIVRSAPKQFEGIISTMELATKFLDDAVIQRSVSHSTVRLEDLKGVGEHGEELPGAIVSVIIPLEFKKSHAAFVRLVVWASLLTMMRGKVARHRVLMAFDEFPSLGKVDAIIDGLAEMRRYRLQINLVMQSISQMRMIYGDAGWKAIEETCDVRQFVAAWGLDTAEHVSRLCGDQTINEKTISGRQTIGRAMLMPNEVMQLHTREQIVAISNLPPMKIGIRPYWERREWRGKFLDNPYHGKTPGLPWTWPFQWLFGRLLRLTVGFVAPLSIIAGLMMLAVLYGWQ